jgi:surfeit locus 1 family protein
MHFKPSFWLTLLLLILALVFCWLGLWQLDRQAEKETLLETIENAPVLSIEQALVREQQYAQVEAYGQYDSQRHILLDNKIFNGRAGVHVITPFTLADGTMLLVNRGWLPLAADRLSLPLVTTDKNPQTITGRLVGFPTQGVRVGSTDLLVSDTWPQLVTYLDASSIETALSNKLSTWHIQLDPVDPSGFNDRQWKAFVMGPSVHGAYAFQWLSLMAATIILWVFLGVRRGKKAKLKYEN